MTGADQAIAHIDVPAVETDTIYGFTLTVKNAVGTHSANTTVTAKPKAEEILPPVAHLTGPATAEAKQQVALSAAASSDPAGKPLTYEWTIPAGITASTNDAALSFTAPELAADTPFTFSVKVSNGSNGSKTDSASHTVTVKKSADEVVLPPVARIAGPETAKANARVELSAASSSDPADKPLTYKWTVPAGITASENGAALSFTAPELTANTPFTFSVEVSNGTKTDTANHVVTVQKKDDTGTPTYPHYVPGTAYKAGDVVQNAAALYQCVVAGWCSSASAMYYAPGTGLDWASAWKTFDGEGEITPPPNPGDAPPYVAGTAYNFGDLVSNNDKVYSCKVPGWCSGPAWAYEPGKGTDWQSAWTEQ
jgi:chitinase